MSAPEPPTTGASPASPSGGAAGSAPSATPGASGAASGASAGAGAAPATGASPAGGAGAPPAAGAEGAAGAAGAKPKVPEPPIELKGFRKSLEHTGIPRSVLTWKPRLPSRNWCIFITIVGTLSYLYIDDRKQCKAIRKEYEDKVRYLSQQPMGAALDSPRKVTVYGARWPEDDEFDRSLRYFRRYVKPYLVAAAVDYEQVHAPLYGSITRIVRANILRKRREALGLQEPDVPLTVGTAMDPASVAQRELEGGIVLVGRPALKEYLAGLKAGWGEGVGDWVWEKEIEAAIADDGVFDEKKKDDVLVDAATGDAPAAAPTTTDAAAEAAPGAAGTAAATAALRASPSFAFLSRPPPALPTPAPAQEAPAVVIPEHLHAPPHPLPPQPPMLLVSWSNHLGFKQIPYMIYDFFTERRKVRLGAEAAYALITNTTRPFVGPADEPAAVDTATLVDPADAVASPSASASTPADTEFDVANERYYKKDYKDLPKTTEKARETYYKELAKRLESARQFARGERELTDEEKKSDKPIVTETDLRAERRKRELRWHGALEGWEIVRPGTPAAWDPSWKGWLQVYDPVAAVESHKPVEAVGPDTD